MLYYHNSQGNQSFMRNGANLQSLQSEECIGIIQRDGDIEEVFAIYVSGGGKKFFWYIGEIQEDRIVVDKAKKDKQCKYDLPVDKILLCGIRQKVDVAKKDINEEKYEVFDENNIEDKKFIKEEQCYINRQKNFGLIV